MKILKKGKWSSRKYSSYQEYLYVITNDNEFEILIYSTSLVGEEFKDISEYLLNKNPNIIIDDSI